MLLGFDSAFTVNGVIKVNQTMAEIMALNIVISPRALTIASGLPVTVSQSCIQIYLSLNLVLIFTHGIPDRSVRV